MVRSAGNVKVLRLGQFGMFKVYSEAGELRVIDLYTDVLRSPRNMGQYKSDVSLIHLFKG